MYRNVSNPLPEAVCDKLTPARHCRLTFFGCNETAERQHRLAGRKVPAASANLNRRHTMNTILRSSVLAAAIIFSASAFAQMGPGPERGMRHQNIPNLTTEQSTKLQALRKAHWDQNAPLRQQLMTKKSEMRSLWLSPKPDQAAIVAKQKEISDLQAKLAEKAINHRFEMRQVLTPEQLAQAGDFGQGRGMGRRGGKGCR